MRFLKFTVAAVLLAATASCTSANDKPAVAPKPTIKIAHNDWLSAELNDAVAKILLEEQLGYTVDLVDAGTSDQWDSIKSGDLHVSLEVWPSGHPTELKDLVDQGGVENGGPLGPVGRVGWFIPTYLLTAHPELATWEGLQDPNVVALFRTADSGQKGRFLGGDPNWVQWDQKLIDNLGLDFTVLFAGSEAAEISMLEEAYTQRSPILFYLWEPHWVFASHDLTLVKLPPYGDVCWSEQKCSYPSDVLFKILWPQLKDVAPDAYQFFKAFNYTDQDQVQMMDAVHGGATVDQAARAWVDTHAADWQAWIPAKTAVK